MKFKLFYYSHTVTNRAFEGRPRKGVNPHIHKKDYEKVRSSPNSFIARD